MHPRVVIYIKYYTLIYCLRAKDLQGYSKHAQNVFINKLKTLSLPMSKEWPGYKQVIQ